MPIPAHLINAGLEKGVLGKFMDEPDRIALCSDLTADTFAIGANKVIFETIRQLYENGHPVTTPTVGADLHNRGLLAGFGGIDCLRGFSDFKVEAYDLEFSISQLLNLSTMRRTLSEMYDLTAKLESPGSTVDDIAKLEIIAQSAEGRGRKRVRLRTVAEVVSEYPGGINSFMRPLQGQKFMRFPWMKAQDRIGGLWPGEVMILGGRPGSGKSAAALQLARYNSQFGGVTAIYNLEMTDNQTIYRSICARAGVSMARFRLGELTTIEERLLSAELTRLASEGVLLSDKPNLTIGEIRASLKQAVRTKGVTLAILDYLQLADAGIKTDSRQLEVAHISRTAKLTAMECGIPFIVLAQLSRKNEEQNREPGLSDLRESGSIEQDADVVLFTHKKLEHIAGGAPKESHKLLFKKARNGPDGNCNVYWDAQKLEFVDLAPEHGENY